MSNKRHVPTLDALRGVAALAVVMRHISGLGVGSHHAPDPLHGFFSHAYLAVDFFFVLSGFVIAKAYEPRLRAGLGLGRYMLIRLKRLYPVIAFGALLGLAAAIMRDVHLNMWLALAGQLLFIPFMTAGTEMFELNNVQWSLFFELWVNAVHARIFRWLTTPRLIAVVCTSFIALAGAAYHYGSIDYGPAWRNLPCGVVRASFGFFAGVLTQRMLSHFPIPRVPVVWIGCGLVMLLGLPVAWIGTMAWARLTWGACYDLAAVLLFPVLVAMAARASTPPALAGASLTLGRLSYPLYAVHLPVLTVAATALAAHGLGGGTYLVFMFAAAGLAVALAVAVDAFLDAPLQLMYKRKAAMQRSA